MYSFKCDGSYVADLKEYTENVVERFGVSSQTAERETIYMADNGNVVAGNLYADMVFNKKVLRKNPYREAFYQYMLSAGVAVDENGDWISSGKGYPISFWSIGYYLVNYRRESVLLKCEKIDIIEEMSIIERLATALDLAIACIKFVKTPAAANLIGRILKEISEDEKIFERLKPVIQHMVANHEYTDIELKVYSCDSIEECRDISDSFFVAAAKAGYVYACNNLAVREAQNIIELNKKISLHKTESTNDMKSDMSDDNRDTISDIEADELKDLTNKLNDAVINYICYLRLAADKYEPYAANRLGLFYITGEINCGDDKAVFKEYVDRVKAKEYFNKATIYPDANSAWAYFNLMKYFYKDYEKNIELMNEHMDYIKELNPAVYDIAIDL